MQNFTPKALELIKRAKAAAILERSLFLEIHHLVLAIFELNIDVCKDAFLVHSEGAAKDFDVVFKKCKTLYGGRADAKFVNVETIQDSASLKKVIREARHFAKKEDVDFISSEHITAGILSNNLSEFYNIMKECGFTPSKGLNFVTDKFSDELEDTEEQEEGEKSVVPAGGGASKAMKGSYLEKYARNLTHLAEAEKLSPVFGREKELKRLTSVLLRKTKNCAVLVGEAGVGKTAVVEALATAIHKGEIPKFKGRVVYEIDLGSMVAGTKYRGQFEEKFKGVLKEATNDKNIILFIDEIHTLVGAGSGEGTLDAANMIKPALARGEVSFIGATTIAEYTKYLEKDSALDRRFQKISIDEPNEEDCIRILFQAAKNFEEFHGVKFSEEAIEGCVRFSRRYIVDRHLPDKAFDVLDESAVLARCNAASSGSEETKLRMEKIKEEKAAMFKANKMDGLKTLKEEESKLLSSLRSSEKPPVEVTVEDVAEATSQMSRVPMDVILKSESLTRSVIEERFAETFVGNKNALREVSKALARSKTIFRNHKKPTANLLFVGPTGVGKTFLAKEIARVFFGSSNALVRIDMSELQGEGAVAKFIGSPAGYVGYEEGGGLVSEVRKRPYSVVLFDEVEKAGEEARQMMLQIMDEGILKDNLNKVASFRDCIIIMTANCGGVKNAGGLGFGDLSEFSLDYQSKLPNYFSPEFLGRLTVVPFQPLSRGEMDEIVAKACFQFVGTISPHAKEVSFPENVVGFLQGLAKENDWDARRATEKISTMLEDCVIDFLTERKTVGNMVFSVMNNSVKLSESEQQVD